MTIFALLTTAIMLALPLATPAPAQTTDCLSEYDIQAAIETGQIKSWPKIKKMAGISKAAQEVSDIQVCLQAGIPYYYVNVMSPDGAVSRLVLNAVDGSS